MSAVKEVISFGVLNYGHIIPINTTITGKEFYKLIQSHYSISDPRNNYFKKLFQYNPEIIINKKVNSLTINVPETAILIDPNSVTI